MEDVERYKFVLEHQSFVHVGCNSEKYECSFQRFLTYGIERNKLTSIIYRVSRNKKKGIGYIDDE
jgi:hypothetical protein